MVREVFGVTEERGSRSVMDPTDMWQQWYEASTSTVQKGAELGQNAVDLLPRWTQMLEEARDNLLAGGNLPADPLQFATRWYNATSGPFSDFVGDVIGREEFLEPYSQFLQSYAGFYKVFKRNSEEYLKSLQLPVRSDISRVAGLVINLEDKIDRIEEVLEDFEYTSAKPATADSIEALEGRIEGIEGTLERLTRSGAQAASAQSVRTLDGRLDGVEDKLDRLLAAVENQNGNGFANASASAPTQSNGPAAEIRATDAARRKAQDLGVNLAEVQGTGSNGEITVGDVRRKGES